MSARQSYAYARPSGNAGAPHVAVIADETEVRLLAAMLDRMRSSLLIGSWNIIEHDDSVVGEDLDIQSALQFVTSMTHSERFGLDNALVSRTIGRAIPSGILARRFANR